MSIFSLKGKKGLITGIANNKSIAYGCAKMIHEAGAEIALTYQNEKTKKYTEDLAKSLDAKLFLEFDVTVEGSLENVFSAIEKKWGKLDFFIHAIAFSKAEDLHTSIINTSADGFAFAMDVSCHSFLKMAKCATPLMKDGGAMLTLTYYGAEKAIENYNIMGPIKAALESSVRYMAKDLGEKGIRVFAVSPGPVDTRAGSGIKDFNQLLDSAKEKSPMKKLVTLEEIGNLAAFLVGPGSTGMTGQTIFVDAGYHIIG
ncbi:MAG: enoyl-ACP reductase FabI [Candidatus Margulisiibacteriota bacterium]|jgi:enoyl-[acyl-carrier protein] reductase I